MLEIRLFFRSSNDISIFIDPLKVDEHNVIAHPFTIFNTVIEAEPKERGFCISGMTTTSTNLVVGLVGIQNDQNGSPTWIIHGVYRMDNMNSSLPMFNGTFYLMKLNANSYPYNIKL